MAKLCAVIPTYDNPATIRSVVERVIARCLERDPRARPASVTQVAAALPGGDLLILERRFSLLRSATRIRRIAAGDIKPNALADPAVIFYADFGQHIDNFEGIGVHRTASGETVLTLISDDNFSPLQRTLLMQFTLLD